MFILIKNIFKILLHHFRRTIFLQIILINYYLLIKYFIILIWLKLNVIHTEIVKQKKIKYVIWIFVPFIGDVEKLKTKYVLVK